MHPERIVFIGGGNMATALLYGLTGAGNDHDGRLRTDTRASAAATDAPYDLRVADPGEARRKQLAELPGVSVFADNTEAMDGADCVIFAVKPQIMREVCLDLKDAVATEQPLLVSVAAGIECEPISRWFGGYRRIVRVMPNTPALVGTGASGLYADRDASRDDMTLVDAIFSAVGLTAWVDQESLIDAVIAVSGSGPAYFFYLLEAMEDAACKQGLTRELAQRLSRQTALGAAIMALDESGTLEGLRRRVTSPGGTTAAAIEVFAEQNLPTIIETAMNAAHRRAQTLADEFGTD